MVHTVKDRRQIGKATYILKMGEMLQSTEVLPARYTPKHDENLNLAGSIGHEAESTMHMYSRTEGNSAREGKRVADVVAGSGSGQLQDAPGEARMLMMTVCGLICKLTRGPWFRCTLKGKFERKKNKA